jgi:hypothetical protein
MTRERASRDNLGSMEGRACDHVCCSTTSNVACTLLNAVARAVVHQSSLLSTDSSKIQQASKFSKELEDALVAEAEAAQGKRLSDLLVAINAWSESKKGLMSGVFGSSEDAVKEVLQLLLDHDEAWAESERNKLAINLVKKWYDTDNKAHCTETFNDDEELFEHKKSCPWLPVSCPNAGCPASYSLHAREKHEIKCPFKVVECPLGCGDKSVRKDMSLHTSTVCSMREVKCPYHGLGCDEKMRQGMVTEHLCENVDNHLRMLYAEEAKLEYRVDEIERWARAIHDDDETRRRGLSAIDAALLTLETKHLDLDKDHSASKAHQHKLEGRIRELESIVKRQASDLAALRRLVDGLRK